MISHGKSASEIHAALLKLLLIFFPQYICKFELHQNKGRRFDQVNFKPPSRCFFDAASQLHSFVCRLLLAYCFGLVRPSVQIF